ncbi:Beta-1,4-mannooligosaccharide phosphorylase [subsurface metagenome]
MPRKVRHDIIHRWEGNPVIDINDISFRCANIYNAGCLKINGKYIYLITFESLNGCTHVHYGESADGIRIEVDDRPILSPDETGFLAEYEEQGILDARITPFDGKYYIIYLAKSKHGFVLCLAETEDFKSIQKKGLISQPDTKAGALFPKKINGKYARLERPNSGGSIWISYSNDLIAWGESEVVLSPRPGYWDSYRIGASAPPIKTEAGWLEIYHGMKMTRSVPIYKIGSVLFDLENPSRVIARCDEPILSPRETYERIGDVNNVVFSCGAIVEANDDINIYYGAADTCICVATGKLSHLVERTLESE